MFIVISATYLGYYMYYDGYIASDINTGDCITYAVEQVLLSENSQEKKKEMIEKKERTVVELGSTKGIFCGHDHKNNYSIEYKTYVPKFYTCVTYCLYLGKHMTRI